jgi:hypothetical protein
MEEEVGALTWPASPLRNDAANEADRSNSITFEWAL